MSWPVTLADRPALMQRYYVRAKEAPDTFDPSLRTTFVFAPCCGRRTPADTVVSLAGLNTPICGGNRLPKTNLDWACDGCRHLLILDTSNGWTWSKLYRALGAPAEVVRRERARELVRVAEQTAKIARVAFRPGDEYQAALNSLPADTTNVPGTERPDA